MKLLQALLEESNVSKAATAAGISRNTAYQYMKKPEFERELNRRRSECINDTVRFLQGKLALCGETLIGIIESPEASDQVKINAINAVYANCKAMTETVEVINRLQKIEDSMWGIE